MVQIALHRVIDALAFLLRLAVPLLLLLGALLLALLLVGLLDRERFRRTLDAGGRLLPRLLRGLLVLGTLGLAAFGLDVVRQSVDLQQGAAQNARYAQGADPAGGETVQQAPSASYLATRSYTRSLTLPPDLVRRIEVQGGAETLIPYLTGQPAENTLSLSDTFRRVGDALVYTREATLNTSQPIRLDTSTVSADLRFVDPALGGRQTYYNASFDGQYSFRNPLPNEATVRFTFPLPVGSGTLSGFRMVVNGQELRAADLAGGSTWEGTVPAGGAVKVRVTYQHQGSRGWSYYLAARREPIQQFDLTVRADRPAKFQRYSLYPTSISRAALGGSQTLRWQLKDVITAQNVAVVFAQGSLRETLAKVHLFMPLALLLGALYTLVWALTRRERIPAARAVLAVLGVALGFGLGGILTAYLPPLLGEVVGALAAFGLGVWALGRAFWLPLALTAAAPLAFLSGGNAGLLLTLLAVAALLLLALAGRRPPRPTPTP